MKQNASQTRQPAPDHPPGSALAETAALSHEGLLKTVNEDRYLVRNMGDRGLILAVADGLGGDVSSHIAAQMATDHLAQAPAPAAGGEEKDLLRHVRFLDLKICGRAAADPDLEAMATTLICGVVTASRLHWLNVGDSRLYLKRDDQLSQISQDQTLARFLVAEGELTPEQARTHYSRDLLDQCVGYGECEPDTGNLELKTDDLLLFTSDGLYKMVPDSQILSVLNLNAGLKEMAHLLVQAALDGGGTDNITVVLARINGLLKNH